MAGLYKNRKQYTIAVDTELFDTLNELSRQTRNPNPNLWMKHKSCYLKNIK